MLKTFYAVVTQFDCDPTKRDQNDPDDKATGPILLERYLDNEAATSEEATREIAKRFQHYGWTRVATITIDIPEE